MQIGIDDVDSSIELEYEACKENQYVRELTQNAKEAGATRIIIKPDLKFAARTNIYRFMIVDNGRGFSPEQFLSYMGYVNASSRAIGPRDNFGLGFKVSALPFNKNGIWMVSWQDDSPAYGIYVWKNPNNPPKHQYEIRRLQTADGKYTEVSSDTWMEKYKEDAVKQFTSEGHKANSGTIVILTGNTGKEDTWCGASGSEEAHKVYGTLSYLNNRYYTFPPGLCSVVQLKSEKANWPKAGETGHDVLRVRTVQGSKDLILKNNLENGSIAKEGVKIHWFLQKPKASEEEADIAKSYPYYSQKPFIGSLFQEEIYDKFSGKEANKYQRMFGLYRNSVAQRVVIVVEPLPKKVLTDKARSRLFLEDCREGLPWEDYAEIFRDNLPECIRLILEEELLDSNSSDLNEEVRKTLADEFRKITPRKEAVDNPNGTKGKKEGNNLDVTTTVEKDVDKGLTSTSPSGGGSGPGGSKSKNALLPRATTDITETGKGTSTKKSSVIDCPRIEWVSETDSEHEDIKGFACSEYDSINRIIYLNRDYPLYQSYLKAVIERVPNLTETIEELIKYEVDLNYMLFVGRLLVMHNTQQHTLHWPTDVWRKAVSKEALTMAMGNIWIGISNLNHRIGRKIGPVITANKTALVVS